MLSMPMVLLLPVLLLTFMLQQHVPGTNEYEATHGMDNAHRNAEQLKGYIPGKMITNLMSVVHCVTS